METKFIIEPESHRLAATQSNSIASIAISLKRIADRLDKIYGEPNRRTLHD